MLVTLEEMKNYLRVDDSEDDGLITALLASAERMCMDILRTDEESGLQEAENGKTAVMYTVAYLYEHREEADHHALNLFTIPGAFCLYKRVLPGQDSLQIYRVIFSASNHP